MKKYLLCFLIAAFVTGLSSAENRKPITWAKIKKLEESMEVWAKKVGDADLIKIGKMQQRPKEIKVIRAFFPYLLPQGFFSRQLDLSCYPSFHQFRTKVTIENYTKWKSCVKGLYGENPPELTKQALKSLRP